MISKKPLSSGEFVSWFCLTAEAITLNPHDSALLAELDVQVRPSTRGFHGKLVRAFLNHGNW